MRKTQKNVFMPDAVNQVDSAGRLRHMLTIEGMSRQLLEQIFVTTERFLVGDELLVEPLLQGVAVANLFFEPSTRTRVTFELAEKNLGANVTNLNIDTSSTKKGESLIDLVHNLEMMGIRLFVIRHSHNGAAHFLAQHLRSDSAVINAGDGTHAHPTQALLDMATLRRYRPDFENLRVAIVGDVLHSRVARSQLHALTILGVREVRLIGPRTLMPGCSSVFGVTHFENIEEGLDGVDVICCLRLQHERMSGALLPSEKEFFHRYGITQKRLKRAAANVLVMHPGPVNRGVEIDTEVLGRKHTVVLEQVRQGIAVRMAVMAMVMGKVGQLEC